MSNFSRWSSASVALLTFGVAVGTILPLVTSDSQKVIAAPESATSFPDIQDHWASPFIKALAEKNILTGYLNGTYRPNKTLARDEFAAIIRQAFNQNQVAQIPSRTVYKDVPVGYWAAPAIEEAYQTGFMTGYPGGFFRPKEEVSKVQAIVSLAEVLDGSSSPPTASK